MSTVDRPYSHLAIDITIKCHSKWSHYRKQKKKKKNNNNTYASRPETMNIKVNQ